MLAQIKPHRPDFVCFIGAEEILYPSLCMGGDGGTIACSEVIPEVMTKLYRDFLAGDHAECRRVQLKIQELIGTMFAAREFPRRIPHRGIPARLQSRSLTFSDERGRSRQP